MEDCKSRHSMLDTGCSKRVKGCECLRAGKRRELNPMSCASRVQNIGLCEQRGEDSDEGTRRRGNPPRRLLASSRCPLNFDVRSYQFRDLDLKIAVGRLPRRDQNVLILRLMGHKQRDIARVSGVTRSMISRRLSMIMDDLKELLATDQGRAKS
jgi:hypothetical protein